MKPSQKVNYTSVYATRDITRKSINRAGFTLLCVIAVTVTVVVLIAAV